MNLSTKLSTLFTAVLLFCTACEYSETDESYKCKKYKNLCGNYTIDFYICCKTVESDVNTSDCYYKIETGYIKQYDFINEAVNDNCQ